MSIAAWRLLVATRSGRRPRSWRRVRSRRRRPELLSRRGGSGAELLARRRRRTRLRIASRRRRSRRLIAARRRWCAGLGVASGRLTRRRTVRRPGRLRLTIGRARRLRLAVGAWRRRRVARHGCSLPLALVGHSSSEGSGSYVQSKRCASDGDEVSQKSFCVNLCSNLSSGPATRRPSHTQLFSNLLVCRPLARWGLTKLCALA